MNEDSRQTTKVGRPRIPLAPVPIYFKAELAPLSRLLVYFAFCLFLNVSYVLYQLKGYVEFMGSSTWDTTANPNYSGSRYIPLMEPLLYTELIVKSAAVLAALTLLILLARRSWFFIKWVQAYLSASLIFQVLEMAASRYLHAAFAARELGKPPELALPELEPLWGILGMPEFGARWGFLIVPGFFLVTLFWLAYFSASERVKKVFAD